MVAHANKKPFVTIRGLSGGLSSHAATCRRFWLQSNLFYFIFSSNKLRFSSCFVVFFVDISSYLPDSHHLRLCYFFFSIIIIIFFLLKGFAILFYHIYNWFFYFFCPLLIFIICLNFRHNSWQKKNHVKLICNLFFC